ncbi:MAG TPA: glycosyltransferase [Oligoflexia bacterium]|nr:glycosyltransferase [Oligoflexia bacterium]HMP47863.1 glycosyltransferase [Oligoflexia bacterium]
MKQTDFLLNFNSANSRQLSLAAVLPRYGSSLGGGAETLVRELFLALNKDPFLLPYLSLEVLTTCAVDHRTWENALPAGPSEEDGILIRRFLVDDRNLEVFIGAEQKLNKGFQLSSSEQISWLENSVNSSALYEFLITEEKKYDLIFFAPYLFGTSFWGSQLVRDKAVLVPCLHDEAYAYLPVFRNLFRHVRGVMWNAAPEEELANNLYNIPGLRDKGIEVGMGFESSSSDVSRVHSPHPRPYILYSGRKETGKNLHYLIDCYEDYRSKSSDPFDFLIIGSGSIDFRNDLPSGVYDKGFVSENEKKIILSNASLFVQPSTNESFSIVLMEAWLEGTPVLVHSDCAVTTHHVRKSGGGYFFRSKQEFNDILTKIKNDPSESIIKGESGKKFVSEVYSWEAVKTRFLKGLQKWISLKKTDGDFCDEHKWG